MINLVEKNFIIECFDKLIERNVFCKEDISPSLLTEEEIINFEKKHNITLPSLFKAYLMTYNYSFTDIYAGMITDINDPFAKCEELNLFIFNLPEKNTLTYLENNINYAKEAGLFSLGFIPIATIEHQGIICIDLFSDENDPNDYGIIWFSFDVLDKSNDELKTQYKVLFEDFKSFLECIFMGSNDEKIDFYTKYADDDKLFDTLDEYHDNDEYEAIISTIFKIPRSHWNNKLYFRLISAHNNLNDFKTAIHYLNILKNKCITNKDKAKWHYMYGYIFYAQDDDEKAKSEFEIAAKLDPSDEDYPALIKECEEYINNKSKKQQTHYKFIKLM